MPSLRPLLLDLLLVALATVASAIIRDNFVIAEPSLVALFPYLAATLSVAGIFFSVFGMSRSLGRFTSSRDGLRIVVLTVIVVLGAVAIGFIVNRMDGIPRGLPVIQGLLIVSVLVGARILARLPYDRRVPSPAAP